MKNKEKLIGWIIGGIVLIWLLSGIFASLFVKPSSKATKTTGPQTVYDETDIDRPRGDKGTPYEW